MNVGACDRYRAVIYKDGDFILIGCIGGAPAVRHGESGCVDSGNRKSTHNNRSGALRLSVTEVPAVAKLAIQIVGVRTVEAHIFINSYQHVGTRISYRLGIDCNDRLVVVNGSLVLPNQQIL